MSLAENLSAELPSCDYTPKPYAGPSKEQVIKTRQEFCNPAIFTYYKSPLMIVDGYMQYVFDECGKRYLDMIGGIVTISCGHCHPKIIERTKEQLEKIQHTTTIYLNPLLGACAEKLASKMPGELKVSYFVNSGSEANDLAISMARLHTGNFDVIALKNAYHGGVASTMGLTSHHTWKYPLPQAHGVHHVTCPDPYRNPFSGTPEEIAQKSAEEIRKTIEFSTSGKIAAFIAEPIQGVGGATAGAESYLRYAYEIAREYGAVCIADEVQTGFGRTGDNYWGFQNSDVTPDIVTMAKGIGNGIPLGAVTTRKEIAQVLAQRIHFNTYGGNPVSMAQCMATLDVIEEDGLQENSRVLGKYLIERLNDLKDKFEVIGDVRGRGLMLGVELVKNRNSKEPAKEETLHVFEEMKNMGVLIGKGGLYGNVLRIKPPMCITRADADFALEAMQRALASVATN